MQESHDFVEQTEVATIRQRRRSKEAKQHFTCAVAFLSENPSGVRGVGSFQLVQGVESGDGV